MKLIEPIAKGLSTFAIWATGRSFEKRDEIVQNGDSVAICNLKTIWKLHPFRGENYTVHLQEAPNAIHRAAQRICFGFRYKLVK